MNEIKNPHILGTYNWENNKPSSLYHTLFSIKICRYVSRDCGTKKFYNEKLYKRLKSIELYHVYFEIWSVWKNEHVVG